MIGYLSSEEALASIVATGAIEQTLNTGMEPLIASGNAMVPAGLEATSALAQEQMTENLAVFQQNHTFGMLFFQNLIQNLQQTVMNFQLVDGGNAAMFSL